MSWIGAGFSIRRAAVFSSVAASRPLRAPTRMDVGCSVIHYLEFGISCLRLCAISSILRRGSWVGRYWCGIYVANFHRPAQTYPRT
ncbi:hypothetical protein DFH07DRAFT_32821 [Mycena maculata]|uniref:Uncharacterized protein n=1 Tax=Mycena maculata TaxID=230809 RepID=A0AAD7K2H5_9AGAR|nr:hypothetical protein DFH07DRAFT_32821 [Mycena maculata]